jgi:F-type H+-transporting ATPase subunit delta
MPGRLSRRSIAEYIANGLIDGKPSKKQLFEQLAGYLIDTQRTKELELIVRDIEFALSEKGVVQATVVSAFELTAETKKALEAFVKTKTKATQVTLSNMVNSEVIGGVKITVPGRELDQTVARQLTVLKTRFKKA